MYISLTEAKTYIGIPAATTADDVLITALIANAQGIIDNYTNRTFDATADAEKTFDAVADVDGRTLYVDNLCAITSITNGDSVVVTADQYTTQPRRVTPYYAIELLASADVTWTYTDDPENAITIDGRWAWSVTAPDAVKQATQRLTAWLYRQKDTNAEADRPVMTDGGVVMPSALPSDITAILRPYRRMV